MPAAQKSLRLVGGLIAAAVGFPGPAGMGAAPAAAAEGAARAHRAPVLVGAPGHCRA